MYVPSAFEVRDRASVSRFIEIHDFATLVTATPDGVDVSHLPLLLQPSGDGAGWGTLVGHVARKNPHAGRFDGETPALAIFHGPHAYVSPAWYETSPAVPTWNYAVVHAHGRPRALEDDDRKAALLAEMIERYEAGRRERWPAELPVEFAAGMRRAIVAFELPIERIEAKFKLGQNRSAADLDGVLAGLDAEGDPASRALAEFTRAFVGK